MSFAFIFVQIPHLNLYSTIIGNLTSLARKLFQVSCHYHTVFNFIYFIIIVSYSANKIVVVVVVVV